MAHSKTKRTAGEAILVAMLTLERNTGLDNFDHDDIVVAAWHVAPEIFTLRNQLANPGRYPDSKRVSMELASGKPLEKLKEIELAETRRYRLTDAGRVRARNLEMR